MAEMPDVVTLTTITSDWGNDIRDRTVQRYSSVANRTTEHPTPSEGDLSYLEDSNTLWVYNGSAWVVGIGDGTLATAMIADDAVTIAKIGPGAVGVTELADANVSGAKAAGSLAGALLQSGGDADAVDVALTTSFVDKAAVVFTKPAAWGTYRIMAWGFAWIEGVGANGSAARIELGGSNGPATANVTGQDGGHGCFHTTDTSTSPITVAIACQRGPNPALANHRHSYVSYLAFRLT